MSNVKLNGVDASNNSNQVSQKAIANKAILEPTKLLVLKNRLQTTIV